MSGDHPQELSLSVVRLGGGPVRLIPEGCDYLLAGSADVVDGIAAAELFAVPAAPPAGGRVLALVEATAPGIEIGEHTVSFAKTPVAAARIVADTHPA